MSYNEIPNILVDSVDLPNKPLSNLEKLMLLKGCQWMDLRSILQGTRPKKAKLNECGILNLDSSFGDGANWIMLFKKGKDKFYFDSYGVQPPSELIVYLKSPIYILQ